MFDLDRFHYWFIEKFEDTKKVIRICKLNGRQYSDQNEKVEYHKVRDIYSKYRPIRILLHINGKFQSSGSNSPHCQECTFMNCYRYYVRRKYKLSFIINHVKLCCKELRPYKVYII